MAAAPGGTAAVAAAPASAGVIEAVWLGHVPYGAAWQLQHDLVAERAAGRIADRILLLEHAAVLTLGRTADPSHVRASPDRLAELGIDVIRIERGGEVTYHGPGQLVAYPIIDLGARGLLVRPLVRALEEAMIATCRAFGVEAGRREGEPGCWIDPGSGSPRKIGALGLRIERGISYHGIALNVAPDLAAYDLIDPCGVPGLVSTSIAAERGSGTGPLGPDAIERAGWVFAAALAGQLAAPLARRIDPSTTA